MLAVMSYGLSIFVGYNSGVSNLKYYAIGLFANTAVLAAFRSRSIFLIFISAFLYLGAYVKLLYAVAFGYLVLNEPIGNFVGTDLQYDAVYFNTIVSFLVVTIVCLSVNSKTVQVTSEVRSFDVDDKKTGAIPVLLIFYCLVVLLSALLNFFIKANVKGVMPDASLPIISYAIKWVVIWGLPLLALSLATVGNNYAVTVKFGFGILFLFDAFLTNVISLSRSMIISATAYAHAGYAMLRARAKYLIVFILAYIILAFSSAGLVNDLRRTLYGAMAAETTQAGGGSVEHPEVQSYPVGSLIVNRWLGVEGIMAATTYEPVQGANFLDFLLERKSRNLSLYDAYVIETPYKTRPTSSNYVTLPGIIGFLLLSKNIYILISGLCVALFLGYFCEIAVKKFTFNTSNHSFFIAFSVAYKFMHFGYATLDIWQTWISIVVYVTISHYILRYFICEPKKGAPKISFFN